MNHLKKEVYESFQAITDSPQNVHNPKNKKSFLFSLYSVRLVIRTLLFLCTLVYYIFSVRTGITLDNSLSYRNPLFVAVWIYFVFEIMVRFFPTKLESTGCRKQFRSCFQSKDSTNQNHNLQPLKTILPVAAISTGLNIVFGILYFTSIIDSTVLFIVSLFFSVLDIICILFYCPFQSWFMKNKCCTTCRIYNWDYIMIFLPVIYVAKFYTLSLFFLALALLVRWELTVFLHPERFTEKTNNALSCSNCSEKLCVRKNKINKSLNHVLKNFRR